MYLAPIRSPHESIYLAPIKASFFVLWFERCSNFNEVMRDSERAVRKIWNEKCWLFCVFNLYFTALHEKYDTTGQMKDIRLLIGNVLLML